MKKITEYDSFRVIAILLSVALFSGLFSLSRQTTFDSWLESYMQNLSTELLGAIFTFILFEIFIGRRHDSKNQKQRLLVEMRNQNNGIATNAVRQMRSNGWLMDGSLKDCNLRNANLKYANFAEADLRGVNFYNANIEHVNFFNAYFDNTTILPDGTKWFSGIDLKRYLIYEHDTAGL